MVHFDATDARIVLELTDNARLSVVELSQRLGISRNTVQAHLAKLETAGSLEPVDRRVDLRSLGFPLLAFVLAQADQHQLGEIELALAQIPEVVEVHGVTGTTDIVIRIAARDGDDLYRLAGVILASPGIQRTEVALSMREMVPFRTAPLLRIIAEPG
jgi:DNA-binding Lrp family transcriptional regulator